MTELAVPAEILNPLTGELVSTRDMAAIGDALLDLRAHKRNVDAHIAAFSAAAVENARAEGRRTLRYEGVTIEVGSDYDLEWDVEKLLELRDLGLPETRYNELVKTQVTFKVDANVARQIAGSNPLFRDVIDAARRHVPKRPRVDARPS